MEYTAKQIDRMSIEELESLAKQIDRMSIEELESLSYRLTYDQRMEWAACGYDGKSFLEILNGE
jgi:hypothetical protein